jgi:NADPH:quinone reductase-like Zn-dependent oxidoreductase
MSYEDAVVIPLGLATAAAGLFDKTQLGLQLPQAPACPATGKTAVVWGGSTSVGCIAIQLAVAAGYEVFTTASPKNFDYMCVAWELRRSGTIAPARSLRTWRLR